MIIAAYKDDELRQGIRRVWRMRRVSEQKQYYKRSNERYKIALPCEYWKEVPFRNLHGLRYRFEDEADKALMADYVETVRKTYKL